MTGGKPKIHKGVAYFHTWMDAWQIRKKLKAQYPEANVVAYTRGYAVQYRISGPYYPELEEA